MEYRFESSRKLRALSRSTWAGPITPTRKTPRTFVDATDLTRWLTWSVNEINDDVEVVQCDRPWDELIDLTTVPLAYVANGSDSRVRCSWTELGGGKKLYLSPGTALPPYPGQLARRYIKLCLARAGMTDPLLVVAPAPEADEAWRVTPPPLIYNPQHIRGNLDYAHIDMISAYWQILAACCPDTEYHNSHDGTQAEWVYRGDAKWLCREGIRDSTLPSVRTWRKAIHTSFNHTHAEAFRYGERTQEPILSGLVNYGLYDLLMDTMHALVQDIQQRWPLVLWQVDGGIVCADDAEEIVYYLASEWGVDMRVDGLGPVDLIGQAWRVGLGRSNQYDSFRNHKREGWVVPKMPDLGLATTFTLDKIEWLRTLRKDWLALAPMRSCRPYRPLQNTER